MESKQKKAFLDFEGDEWFFRNSNSIANYNPEEDAVINLIKDYNLKAQTLLELGCSAGYRLNAIKEYFPDSIICGLEPSKLAIEYGLKNYPEINFVNGTADDLSSYKDASFDIIIVGFLLYVIDRDLLLKVISEIDRVLKNGGKIILVDFFSELPTKNSYQHIKDALAFSFKQNYDEIFLSTKLYHLIDKSSYNHLNKSKDSSEDYYNKYSISLLRKDLISSYK
jgi:ubiquinone/menaquinone biosynthesis C-methylase UbiE